MNTEPTFLEVRQAELQQLQREYRHMELNRRAYAEESQALLRKQQQTIDKLRRDNDALRSEIAIVMRGSNRPLTISQQENLQKLHEQTEKFLNSIDTEKKNIQVMEEQIDIMKQKILHQRRTMGGVNATKENQFMIEKQIRILENRLEKSLIKFNEAIAQNKTLRDKIDDLRRERVVFENIYRKMERELQEKKRKMAEIIEVSNQSYEQRDTYQMEIAAIEQSNRKEQEEFEEQMLELGRLLDTELALPPPGVKSKLKLVTAINGGIDALGDSQKTARAMTASETIENTALERVQNFEEAFNKIKAATGITDIEELVHTFIKNEDHNFSLFNYVNEQNNDIEKCEEQIAQLKEEEQKFAQESGDDAHQHKQILKELEGKLQVTESMAEKYEIRCQDLQRTVESLKRGIQSIFEKLELREDVLNDAIITESNMVHYLGIIEQNTNQLLESYAEVKHFLVPNVSEIMSPSKSIVLLGSGPKIPMGQELVHVNPPKLDDYNSDDDDDEDEDETRPFTLEELKTRTLNRLQRKGQGVMKSPKKGRNNKANANRVY